MYLEMQFINMNNSTDTFVELLFKIQNFNLLSI